jgi:hypothetical protein
MDELCILIIILVKMISTLFNYAFSSRAAKTVIPNYVPYIKCKGTGNKRYKLPMKAVKPGVCKVRLLSAERDGVDITDAMECMAGPNMDFFGQTLYLGQEFERLDVMFQIDGWLTECTYGPGDLIDFYQVFRAGLEHPERYRSRLAYLDLAVDV